MQKNTTAHKKAAPAPKARIHKKPTIQNQTQKTHRSQASKLNGKLNGFFNDSDTNVALGAVALAIGGGLAAFFLLKPNEEVEEHFTDQAYDTVKNAYEYATDYAGNIRDYAGNMKDTAYDMYEQPYSTSLLVTGIISGTLLGASAIYLLSNSSNRSSENLMEKLTDIMDTVKEAAHNTSDSIQSNKWFSAAQEIIESLVDKAGEYKDDVTHHKSHFLNDALEIGLNGFRVWQNLKKR